MNSYTYAKRTLSSFNFNYYILLLFLLFVISCRRDRLPDPQEFNKNALEIKEWLVAQKELPEYKNALDSISQVEAIIDFSTVN